MNDTTAHDHHFEPRVEDDALIRGLGRFVEDAPQPNQAHARVRALAARACAHQRRSRRRRARAAPGVVAVLTHTELDAAGVGSTSVHPPLDGRNGAKLIVPFRPALARDARDACRPAGRAGGRRDASRRRRTQPSRSRSTTRSFAAVADARAALAPGCAAALARGARQCRARLARPGAGRRQQCARDRADFRRRRACGARHASSTSASSSTRWSRAARPRATTRRTTSYTLRSCSQGADPQREQLVAMMGIAAREGARHHRGRRRRVRAEDRGLSGISERCWSPRSSPAGRSPGWRRARNPS